MNVKVIQIAIVSKNKEIVRLVSEKLKTNNGEELKVSTIDPAHSSDEDITADVLIIDADETKFFNEETLERLRSEREMAVVIVGSGKNVNLPLHALQSGADDFLIKEDLTEENIGERIVAVHKKFLAGKKGREIYRSALIAQKKKEAINELVVTICHEFNNPLAAIKISTDILSRQKLTPEHREAVEGMERNIRLFEKKINTLRDRHS